MPAALDLLAEIFPAAPGCRRRRTTPSRRATRPCPTPREHAAIFDPMRRLFALVREIGTAITHEVGAFG